MKDQQQDQRPLNLGPSPETHAIAELLVERYPVRDGEKVEVTVRRDPLPGLLLSYWAGPERFDLSVDYLRGAQGREVWMIIADALDALFGMLIESGRSHRDLPSGDEVEYDGAFFRVDVQRTLPELVDAASRLLDGP